MPILLLNPKYEVLNPKQIKILILNVQKHFVSDFVLWSLEFVSYFLIRI